MRSGRTTLVALTALVTSGCGLGVHFADYRHTVTLPDAHLAGTVNSIQVSSDSGHVNVSVTTSGGGVSVHRVVHYESGHPHPGQRLDAGTLTFTSGCSRCSIDYDLVVPASVHVQAHTDNGRINVTGVAAAGTRSDSGHITIRHIAGDVAAHTDSGGIDIEDIGGTLEASTDSGPIHASALHATTAHASSDSGLVNLEFTVPPNDVQATTDSGPIRLIVPGGPYFIDARTDSGGKDLSRIATAPNSPHRLYLRSDSGHVAAVPPASG